MLARTSLGLACALAFSACQAPPPTLAEPDPNLEDRVGERVVLRSDLPPANAEQVLRELETLELLLDARLPFLALPRTSQALTYVIADRDRFELYASDYDMDPHSGAFVAPGEALFFVEIGAGLQDGHDVVANGQFAEYRCLLGQVAYTAARTLVHSEGSNVFTIDCDNAPVGRNDPDNHIKAGGLSCAVRPQQTDDLATVNRYGDIVYHFPAAIGFGQIICSQLCHCRPRS